MKITGSKQVKGFNIAKHNEFKHGSLFAASSDKLAEEGNAEGEEGEASTKWFGTLNEKIAA